MANSNLVKTPYFVQFASERARDQQTPTPRLQHQSRLIETP